MDTAEQQARDMLERMGWDAAQGLTTGDVVELANLIAERDALTKDKKRLDALEQYILLEGLRDAARRKP